MKKLGLIVTILIAGYATSSAAQTKSNTPNAPQYQTGTTNIPNSSLAPTGTTTGTALNGNTQVTVPTGSNTYVYGQNASQSPSPGQPGSTGGTAGVGFTFK